MLLETSSCDEIAVWYEEEEEEEKEEEEKEKGEFEL